MLATLIANDGYSVATARDGREAIQLLDTVRPELILLDVCMPGMDGATFRQQQRRHRDWIHIPTVVITGAYDEPVLDMAVEATRRKPVRKDDVLALVRQHCTH